jgi:protein-S-isoprenylcysteine O-methyltransferase Ste14
MSWLESRIPPPAVAFLFAAAMWVLARQFPSFSVQVPMKRVIAFTLAGLAIGTIVAGAVEFHRAKTTVNPLKPEATTALVTSGVYRLARNPMYVGMATILLAWAIYLSHPLALLGVAAFVAYIHRFQIVPEEKAMRALFPGAFDAYARRVRRWL